MSRSAGWERKIHTGNNGTTGTVETSVPVVQSWHSGQKNSEIRRWGKQRFETRSTRIPHTGENAPIPEKEKTLKSLKLQGFSLVEISGIEPLTS